MSEPRHNLSTKQIEKLVALATASLEGDISDEDFQRLNEWLDSDESARELYLRFMADSHALRTWATGASESQELSAEPTAASHRPGLITILNRHLVTHPTPFSISVATIVIGLIITAMAFMAAPFYRSFVQNEERAPRQSYEIVARLTGLHEAVWENEIESAHRGAHLVKGRHIALKEGLAEVTFDSGARVTLEGPALLIIQDENSASLEHGRVTALVRPDASGFRVETPLAEIVDLGTEFGVAVSRDGNNASVHVFQGKVALKLESEPENRHVLLAGESAVVSADIGLKRNDAVDEQLFVRKLPSLEEDYPPDTIYSQLVLDLDPVLYYRMEPSRGMVLYDSGPLHRHGVLRRTSSGDTPYVDGVDNQALQLRGFGFGDFGLLGHYPAAQQNQLSVVAWVYVEQHSRWANIASHWGDSRVGQFHFGQHNGDGDLCVNVAQANGGAKIIREGQQRPLPLGKWQHVAFVVDGEQALLYRNGDEVAAAPCRGVRQQSSMVSLAIGGKTNDDGKALSTSQPALWHGAIDELALFHKALPEDVIRRLSKMPAKVEPEIETN